MQCERVRFHSSDPVFCRRAARLFGYADDDGIWSNAARIQVKKLYYLHFWPETFGRRRSVWTMTLFFFFGRPENILPDA